MLIETSSKFCDKRLLFPRHETAIKMNVYCYSERKNKRHFLELKKINNVLFFKQYTIIILTVLEVRSLRWVSIG